MFIVTGGAGFIGSAMVWKLNSQGIADILVVDELDATEKWKNLVNLEYEDYLHKDVFLELLIQDRLDADPTAVIHMGACSSTTEPDSDYLYENNTRYSRILCEWALTKNARFINASSAATYGDGAKGFSDDDALTPYLKPLNMYGYSKQLFDLWLLKHELQDSVASLKFFNVFGPNEYHKGDMRSVVHKAFGQIGQTGKLGLFKSYRDDYGHGEQKRDFIYVKDCVDVMWWLLENPEANGIINVGTGRARSWNDLASAVFAAMGKPENIEYIEMPEGLREKYQYFTQAETGKLKALGCPVRFTSLEDAVADYVDNYLMGRDEYLGL